MTSGASNPAGVITASEPASRPATIDADDAAELRSSLRGSVLVPGDAGYELMALAIYWNAPEGEPIPEEHRGAPVIAVAGCWSGPVAEGEAATRALREIAEPIADLSGPMPFVEAQRLFDPDYPKGGRYYWKSLHLDELGDDVIDFIHGTGSDRPTPHSTVEVWALGGAIARVPPDATAFHNRTSAWMLAIEANSHDAATDAGNIAWVRRRFEEARRFSQGGTYFNFAGFLEEGEEMLARAFGANYDRIRQVKARYDPDDVFRHNLRIPVGR